MNGKYFKAKFPSIVSLSSKFANYLILIYIPRGNEVNLGQIKAGFDFDETHGFRFISYAVLWIRQKILKHHFRTHRMNISTDWKMIHS